VSLNLRSRRSGQHTPAGGLAGSGQGRPAFDRSINMQIENWQVIWPFEFGAECKAGTSPDAAAMKANRPRWHRQNQSLKQDCGCHRDTEASASLLMKSATM
jgi:hypothetical protein